jgi:osmotically-inducible protein OsmY
MQNCWIGALLILTAATGFGQSRPTAQAAPPAQAKKTAKAPASDAHVEQAIRARLAASKIGKNGFTVRVQGGTATLEGRTDVIQHKGTATRLAKRAGATRVVNKIQVSQAAKDKAARNLSSPQRAQVKRAELTARSEPRSNQ